VLRNPDLILVSAPPASAGEWRAEWQRFSTLAAVRNGRVMAYGTMGGDGQPQTQAALFTRHVLYRQPLAKAVDAPLKILDWVESCACVSRPMTTSHCMLILLNARSCIVGRAQVPVRHLLELVRDAQQTRLVEIIAGQLQADRTA